MLPTRNISYLSPLWCNFEKSAQTVTKMVWGAVPLNGFKTFYTPCTFTLHQCQVHLKSPSVKRFLNRLRPRFNLPSNWYCIILLNTSNKKNTRWWLAGLENRYQGVENASNKCNSLLAATMDRLFRYGDTVKKKWQIVWLP